METEGSL